MWRLLGRCLALIAALIAALTLATDAALCRGEAKLGNPNQYAVLDGFQQSELINTVPNGKAYRVVLPHNSTAERSNVTLVHLWGTPYQMGYAQGQLVKEQVLQVAKLIWAYMEIQVAQSLPGYLPTWLADLIADVGLSAALDVTYELSYEWSGSYFYEELHGIADASGADFSTLMRIHMLAGLTQGDCSMFGAWGEALAPGGTSLLQLRALDWDMEGPFRDYSQITVYHPSEGNGHGFVNVGYTAFIGGLTGMSATKLGISEIGAAFADASFGEMSRMGVPFVFLLRDILQFDYTIDDAINRMINSRRTCDLMLGVGDGKLNEFRGFQYSYSVLNIFNDLNLKPDNSTWHPKIKDIVYWGMDWICPAYNRLLSELLIQHHGKITAEVGIHYISAMEQSGSNHIAFYDLPNMKMYVSFASPFGVAGPAPAYARQYTAWDVNRLLAETQ